MDKPLAGLKVVELARILAGPWAGQLLADLGAEVIKVERPGAGDDTRAWGPPFAADGSAAYFHACNRGKSSVAIDLDERRRARSRCARSSRDADVLIENFKVGGLARYGLDYASLSRAQPAARSIARSPASARTGPMRRRAGYDFMIQGMGGIMDLTGEPDGEPQKTGVAFADIFTGLYAVDRDPRRAARARGDRQGLPYRHGPARHAGRRARQPGDELSGLAARCRAGSATPIPTSRPTRPSRSPTAMSSSRSAMTASSGGSAPCSALGRGCRASRPMPTGSRNRDGADRRCSRPPSRCAAATSCSPRSPPPAFRPARSTTSPQVFADPQVDRARPADRSRRHSGVASPIVIDGKRQVADRPSPALGERSRAERINAAQHSDLRRIS